MGILGGSSDRRSREARSEFLESPVGRARTSFERGDLVLQLELDPANQRPAIIPTHNAPTVRTSTDVTEILNAVCREGWDVVTASIAFPDSGQRRGAAGPSQLRGHVAGCYLFRRAPQYRGVRSAQD